MKIRSDSLFAELTRLGKLDDFCAWILAEQPGYKAMLERLGELGLHGSLGALHNFVTFHLHQWRVQKALDQAAAEKLDLPPDLDAETAARIKALKLDLAMRDISDDQKLALIRLEQDGERNALASRKLALLEARAEAAEAKTRELQATLADPVKVAAELDKLLGRKSQ